MKIKLLANLPGHSVGKIVEVPAKNGILLDVYWRRRLRDGEIEIVKPQRSKTNGQHRRTT